MQGKLCENCGMVRIFLLLFLIYFPLFAQDSELAAALKIMTPKLADRPAGPIAIFKLGGGRGTTSTLGEFLADRITAQLSSLQKRELITREQTKEMGPPTQSRAAELVDKFHVAVIVTGSYTIQDQNISVTIFFRDPATFIAFAGENATFTRTRETDAFTGEIETITSSSSSAAPIATRRRGVREEREPVIFRPESARTGSSNSAATAPREIAPASSKVEVPSKPKAPVIAPGTEVTIRLVDPIYSSRATAGQRFRASLDQDLVQEGQVIAGRLSDVWVEILSWNGKTIGLTLRHIRTRDGQEIGIATAPLYRDAKASAGGRAKGGLKWGAVGGAIGAAAGGAVGAAAGAGAGAAAGSTIDHGEKGVTLPSETKLAFRAE
jgi:hypothetical protein